MRRNEGAAKTNERLLAIVLFFFITAVLWEIPGVYSKTLSVAFRYCFGDFFDTYFWYRTRMDAWSSWQGLLVASWYPYIKANYTRLLRTRIHFVSSCAVSSLLLAGWVTIWLTHSKDEYTSIHRFVGLLPLPFYLFVRNLPPFCSQIMTPLEVK